MQSALLVLLLVLVLRKRSGLLDSLIQNWRRFVILGWVFVLVGAVIGFYLMAEYTFGDRKMATYLIAPRALSVWLALATVTLVFNEYFKQS